MVTINWDDPGARRTPGVSGGGWEPPAGWFDPQPAPAPTITPPNPSVVTGVDPSEIHNVLYGRVIPLSCLGLARIGTAGLIFGPYFNAGTASFAVSFGFPANPTGTRRVYEVSLDSKVAWELAAGSPAGALDPAGFISAPFTCRFYSGTQTQGADPLEIEQFGAQAVAYRPHMMLWFENLPVADFDGKVPFVSAKFGDVTDGAVPGDGINLGEVLERFAYSPWLEYDSGSFETTGVADIVQAMILTEEQSFLDLLRVTARVYRTLDIVQTDRLRVNDRGATVAPDVVLNRDHIAAESGVQFVRQEQAAVARELELTTIDPDADYVFMTSKAARPRAPVPVTASVGKDAIMLPVVIAASTRASLVTFAKYAEDNARKRVSLQTMLYGYALEPGDLFRLDNLVLERYFASTPGNFARWRSIAAGFDPSEIYKVIETSHGANYINEIVGEAILKCAITFDPEVDPYSSDVILLLHADIVPLVDSSVHDGSVSFGGGAQLDTTVKKFGAASFLLDGTGDYVLGGTIIPEYEFSPTNTSPYTIELWVRFAALSNTQILIAQNTFAQKAWVLYSEAGSSELTFVTSSDGSTVTATLATTAADLAVDTWYHVAVDKDTTGKVRIYVNGVMQASDTPANSVIAISPYPFTVGSDGAGSNALAGNIDEVRISTVSRYGSVHGDASFSVPTLPFPDPP